MQMAGLRAHAAFKSRGVAEHGIPLSCTQPGGGHGLPSGPVEKCPASADLPAPPPVGRPQFVDPSGAGAGFTVNLHLCGGGGSSPIGHLNQHPA